MSASNQESNGRTPKESAMKLLFWFVVGLFAYLTIITISVAPNIFQSVIASAIIWFVASWFYRKRKIIGAYLESDMPLVEYIKQQRGLKKAAIPASHDGSKLSNKPRSTFLDFSEADNESLQPLSSKEKSAFERIVQEIRKNELNQ